MSPKLFGLIALAAVVLLWVALACGDDSDDITVRRGLAVGAVAQGFDGLGGGSVEVAVPFAPVSLLVDRGTGFSGPLGPGVFTFLQQGQTGINVQGFGSATATAETARIQFLVSSGSGFFGPPPPQPICPPGEPCPEPFFDEPAPPEPITDEDLAPIIDAIKAQGVADDDIQVITDGQPFFDPFGPSVARINLSLSDPEGRVQPIVDAARDAADEAELFLQNASVLYAVDDCAPLEREAIRAAVEDARDRAQLVADVLAVGVGQVTFVSQFFQSPFGFSACDPSALSPFEKGFDFGGFPFDPSQPAEVELIATVSITFAIQ